MSVNPFFELGSAMAISVLVIVLAVAAAVVVLIVVLIRALLKYLRTERPGPGPWDTSAGGMGEDRSLGERLKAHRTSRGMTQEYLAESLGVSRQAVSKWENGTSEPSTANLIALARLYGISVDELLTGGQA